MERIKIFSAQGGEDPIVRKKVEDEYSSWSVTVKDMVKVIDRQLSVGVTPNSMRSGLVFYIVLIVTYSSKK
jgi:hypothetical protein